MVADLVAEMAEQRAIRLAHGRAQLLALRIVRLFQRDHDHAVVVSGHHLRTSFGIGQEVENEPVLRVFGAGVEWQTEAQQAVEQPVLRDFELAPGFEIARVGQIGDRPDCGGKQGRSFRLSWRATPSCRRRERHWRRTCSGSPSRLRVRARRLNRPRAPVPRGSLFPAGSRGDAGTSRRRCFQRRGAVRRTGSYRVSPKCAFSALQHRKPDRSFVVPIGEPRSHPLPYAVQGCGFCKGSSSSWPG